MVIEGRKNWTKCRMPATVFCPTCVANGKKPLISGRSPSPLRAAATRGKPAPREAEEAGILLRVIEHELQLAQICERAASSVSDAGAIVRLRAVSAAARRRVEALTPELARRDGSAPRDDEVEVATVHDSRDLEGAHNRLGDVLTALAGELDGVYSEAVGRVDGALKAILESLRPPV